MIFLKSPQEIAKMEAAHRTVSTELHLTSLFRLGASPRDVARLLSQKPRNRAAWCCKMIRRSSFGCRWAGSLYLPA